MSERQVRNPMWPGHPQWDACTHEWEPVEPEDHAAANRQCVRCGCLGNYYEKQKAIVWPTVTIQEAPHEQ